MNFWSLLGIMIVIGVVIQYWWVFALAVVAFGAFHILRATAHEHDKMVAAQRHHEHELRARADQQHSWTMCGDQRGTYGQYPPAV